MKKKLALVEEKQEKVVEAMTALEGILGYQVTLRAEDPERGTNPP